MLRDDYHGAFDPALDLDAFSRRALAVLGREWLLHGHLQDRVAMPLVHSGRSREEMQAVAIDEWMAASPVYSRRTQAALRFGRGDVATIMKNLQLDIGAPHQFMDFRCTVHDESHGEFHLAHCGALMDVEPMGVEYVQGMCHDIEDPTFDATAVATNPRARVRPVHRPPRVPTDRHPHCHWTVEIDPGAQPVEAHPNLALVEASLAASIPVRVPDADREPGGWTDYSGGFDPDFELEDLSHRALVVALQEFAVQSHLLFRALLISVTQRFGDDVARALNPEVFTGLAGITAQRLRDAMSIDGADADAVAKLLQVHPVFFPRTYVDLRVEVIDAQRARFAIGPCAALSEPDGLTWFSQLGSGSDRALDAIVWAIDPRARCEAVTTGQTNGTRTRRSSTRPRRPRPKLQRSRSRRSVGARRSHSRLGDPCVPETVVSGARIGTAIVAYIEPHEGHAREFNRWYERDHFPAAVLAGPGAFSGARFVATRECKAMRRGGRRFGAPARGSYLAVAWLLPGAQEAWDAWVVGAVERLAAEDRMFPHRDHLHTAVYRIATEARTDEGPPAAQALDHPFAGVAVVAIERADSDSDSGAVDDAAGAWVRALVGPAVPVAVVLSPQRLVVSVLDGAAEGFDDHRLVVAFLADDVLATWSSTVAPALTALADAGTRVGFAGPFLRTVPGTDTYVDDL